MICFDVGVKLVDIDTGCGCFFSGVGLGGVCSWMGGMDVLDVAEESVFGSADSMAVGIAAQYCRHRAEAGKRFATEFMDIMVGEVACNLSQRGVGKNSSLWFVILSIVLSVRILGQLY